MNQDFLGERQVLIYPERGCWQPTLGRLADGPVSSSFKCMPGHLLQLWELAAKGPQSWPLGRSLLPFLSHWHR